MIVPSHRLLQCNSAFNGSCLFLLLWIIECPDNDARALVDTSWHLCKRVCSDDVLDIVMGHLKHMLALVEVPVLKELCLRVIAGQPFDGVLSEARLRQWASSMLDVIAQLHSHDDPVNRVLSVKGVFHS